MASPRFMRLLALAREHADLLIDLSNEREVLSRAQLLHYMEHHGVAVALKDALITDLSQSAILAPEQDGFSVNPTVVALFNYYERRGRLISATFLRDQMLAIAERTDELQRQLFAAGLAREAILDLIDDLSRLVREVREAGSDHYIACMRLLGDIKRAGDRQNLERRLVDLETAQRRYIEPLRDLIDPGGEYVPRIRELRRQITELGQHADLLAQSQELDRNRRRLGADLFFIDHDLLRGFGAIVDTARTLLRSLMDEKSIKDALAFCLGRLDAVWAGAGEMTVTATGRNTFQAAPLERAESFFTAIVHRRLLPRPRPLSITPPERSRAEESVLTEARIWRVIAAERTITSWPAFVASVFLDYSEAEQLRVIALPLLREHPSVRIDLHTIPFTHRFSHQHLQMNDFGVRWEGAYGR